MPQFKKELPQMTDSIASQDLIRQSSWIWLRGKGKWADTYACFRKKFEISRLGNDAHIEVAADSDFVAWLNGVEIARGQFSDFAHIKTYSRFPIAEQIRHGTNLLAIEVFHRGEDFFDHQAGEPGLLASLKMGSFVLATDATWKGVVHPAFRSRQREHMTKQCGFTFAYDARHEAAWREASFDDSSWKSARIVQPKGVGTIYRDLTPRPLSRLMLGELPAVRVLAQGSVVLSGERGSVARIMSRSACRPEFPWDIFSNERLHPSFDGCESTVGLRFSPPADYAGSPANAGYFLSPGAPEPLRLRASHARTDGRYFLIDLGCEMVGLLEWEVEASAGTVLHVAHGEHLDNGRVRSRVGGRNFADRYVCGTGKRRFQMPFRRVAGRYLEIHVLSKGEVSFYSFGLRPVEYPTQRLGAFESPDTLVNRVQEIAVRTLELCRHEHYEDCPWREQSLYAYDSRLQALHGYYAFGDYRFPEVSFSLLGRTLEENGFLALTAPGRCEITIPIFTFTWIAALGEHWLYSGDSVLFTTFRESIEAILEKAFARLDQASGLYRPPEAPEFWHFYEWTPGLCGPLGRDNLCGKNHAGYNLHLHEAIRWYAWMLEQAGEEGSAKTLRRRLARLGHAIHSAFWDSSACFYRSVLHPNGKREGAHELIQGLALNEGVVPGRLRETLVKTLAKEEFANCTLSAMFYLLRGVFRTGATSREWIRQKLFTNWKAMAFSGATTMWETAAAGNDFDYSGSLCHGWSALPVFYNQAIILGVEPITPGFRKFRVRIQPSAQSMAKGTIPTPHGKIEIAWKKSEQGLHVSASGPSQLVPTLEILPEAEVCQALYNGRAIPVPISCMPHRKQSIPTPESNSHRLRHGLGTKADPRG